MTYKVYALLLIAAAPLAAEKKVIIPPELTPAAGAPAPMFSPGILVDGTLYISGQIGRDPKDGSIPEEFEAEVKNCLNYIGAVLKAAGMTYDDVVAVQVYLTDLNNFQAMNKVYAGFFKDPRPTRTTVGVAGLVNGGHIEITVTARQ